MGLVSVIIPVYKVEQFLDKCVESVINQTYSELEIILVDDGSPDSCPTLCDDWAKKDSRIKVLHKQNGGLSSARNSGIKMSTGQFLYFLDSDDYITPQCIEILVQYQSQNGVDIVAGNFQIIGNNNIPLNTKDVCLNSYYQMMQAIINKQTYVMSCNKLVSRKIFDKYSLFFRDGLLHEDLVWNFELLNSIEAMYITTQVTYTYVLRDNSISRSKDQVKHVLHFLKGVQHNLDFLEKNGVPHRDLNYVELLNRVKDMRTICANFCLDKKITVSVLEMGKLLYGKLNNKHLILNEGFFKNTFNFLVFNLPSCFSILLLKLRN